MPGPVQTSILEFNQEEVTALVHHKPQVCAVGDQLLRHWPLVCAVGNHLLRE